MAQVIAKEIRMQWLFLKKRNDIKDLAALANVDSMTIKRALKGEPVSDNTFKIITDFYRTRALMAGEKYIPDELLKNA